MIRLQKKNQPQKLQIKKEQLQPVKDFQECLGDINWLQPTVGLRTQERSDLFQIYNVTRT